MEDILARKQRDKEILKDALLRTDVPLVEFFGGEKNMPRRMGRSPIRVKDFVIKR
jgi:hypothetical protein